jgi:hypothetical protein
VWSDEAGGYVWDEERVEELLRRGRAATLFVSGTVSNQGRFYDRFDEVVLLSGPAATLLARIDERTDNPYGKSPEERELVLRHLEQVEPLLRATATAELDATAPLEVLADRLERLAGA